MGTDIDVSTWFTVAAASLITTPMDSKSVVQTLAKNGWRRSEPGDTKIGLTTDKQRSQG